MRGTTKREDSVFWIIALDDQKKEVHMFWEVKATDPNLLPVLATFDRTSGERLN